MINVGVTNPASFASVTLENISSKSATTGLKNMESDRGESFLVPAIHVLPCFAKSPSSDRDQRGWFCFGCGTGFGAEGLQRGDGILRTSRDCGVRFGIGSEHGVHSIRFRFHDRNANLLRILEFHLDCSEIWIRAQVGRDLRSRTSKRCDAVPTREGLMEEGKASTSCCAEYNEAEWFVGKSDRCSSCRGGTHSVVKCG